MRFLRWGMLLVFATAASSHEPNFASFYPSGLDAVNLPGPRVLLIGVGGGELARVTIALERVGFRVDICSTVLVPSLPEEANSYRKWCAIVLGPLPKGARSFTQKQMQAIAEYVRTGGGIVFVGGMDSFSGENGRAGYFGTPLAEIMPVDLKPGDDFLFRDEVPFPVADHPVLEGLPRTWAIVGERNRQQPRKVATVLVRFAEDPMLVVAEIGKGRSAALLTTWGWWSQRHFVLWEGFPKLWANLVSWVGRAEPTPRKLDFEVATTDKTGCKIVKFNGRPMMVTSKGEPFYAFGTSVEGSTLDFIARGAKWGFNLFHVWSNEIVDCARACAIAEMFGVKVALFVPQVPPFAKFHDGSTSGDNIPYPVPWHRVPDFYNPEWEKAFRQAVRKFNEAVKPHLDSVLILWVTNEPEIYKGWGDWLGPDFCIDTQSTRKRMRQVAQGQFVDIVKLNEFWSEGEHSYKFGSWDEFERRVVDELFSDYNADNRLNRNAHFWLINFVRNVWLKEWHLTVKKILEEEGLRAPLLSARHNYNSAPDLSLIPWETLDICGKNLYTHEFSDAYVVETWDAFRASGLAVLMSEWGVQPHKPPLGYLHDSDEINRAEQVVLGRVLASRCPWVVGDVWSNVRDIDFPWGFLDEFGKTKPFVELLGHASRIKPFDVWNPLEPGPFTLTPESFETPDVKIYRTKGNPTRKPGVVFK
ncbi:MAG: glutamine amidotransferase [Armatimonadetes bacterium]|nr:glutamine amidotransferase [Armatimonadota bacterium]